MSTLTTSIRSDCNVNYDTERCGLEPRSAHPFLGRPPTSLPSAFEPLGGIDSGLGGAGWASASADSDHGELGGSEDPVGEEPGWWRVRREWRHLRSGLL